MFEKQDSFLLCYYNACSHAVLKLKWKMMIRMLKWKFLTEKRKKKTDDDVFDAPKLAASRHAIMLHSSASGVAKN